MDEIKRKCNQIIRPHDPSFETWDWLHGPWRSQTRFDAISKSTGSFLRGKKCSDCGNRQDGLLHA